MCITPFPDEERVGDYRKESENIQVENTSGTRTNGRTDGENVSHKPTYAEMMTRVRRSGKTKEK